MRTRRALTSVLFLALSGALLWWFVSGLHPESMLRALRSVAPWWLIFSACLILLEYLLRAVRWGVLHQEVDPEVRLADLWVATTIGNAFNTLLPLRAGDIVRPAVLAQRREIPFTTVLSTAIVERIFELAGVVLALLVLLINLPEDMLSSGGLVADVQHHGVTVAGIALALIVAVVFLGGTGGRGLVALLVKPMPRRWELRVLAVFDQITLGLAAVGNPLRLLGATILTALSITCGVGAIWSLFQAFGTDLSVSGCLFLQLALMAQIAIPQAPGFLGGFQFVMEEAVLLWNIEEGLAEASAIMLWLVWFAPITIWGMVDAWRQGISLGRFSEDLLGDAED